MLLLSIDAEALGPKAQLGLAVGTMNSFVLFICLVGLLARFEVGFLVD